MIISPSSLGIVFKLALGTWLVLTVLLGIAVLQPQNAGAASQISLRVGDDGRSVKIRIDGSVSCTEEVRK